MRHPSAEASIAFFGAAPEGGRWGFAKSAINGAFRGKKPSTAILGLMAHKKGLCLIGLQPYCREKIATNDLLSTCSSLLSWILQLCICLGC